MESNEIRKQLHEAERAAAAPYINYPEDPKWAVALLSLVLPLLCIVLHQLHPDVIGSVGPGLFLPSIAISVIVIVVVTEQRKRRGTYPAGEAPRELKLVYRWYGIVAVIIGLVVIPLAILSPLTVSMPIAWVLNLGGILWFGKAYDRAAARVRERLA